MSTGKDSSAKNDGAASAENMERTKGAQVIASTKGKGPVSKSAKAAFDGDAAVDLEACLAMITRLIAAARSEQNASDMFDETIGQLLGTNRTDGRCLDLIQRYDRLTAGQLAELSGLSTGAVTTVIDRLELGGYAQRVRDPSDRRRVFVELTDFTLKLSESLYRPMGEAFKGAISGVSLRDMQIIAQYLEFSERVSRTHTKILQDHVPANHSGGKDHHKETIQRAKSFARDSGKIQQALIDSWGIEPEAPPVAGKRIY